MSKQAGPHPLPPGIHTGKADIRLRPIPCPACGVTLHARDIEELPDGYQLICKCGIDVLEIREVAHESDC